MSTSAEYLGEKMRASNGPQVRGAVAPPLKWAGGKRWFATKYRDLAPAVFRSYYEPFLGSGALFFALEPRAAVLSDVNADLINCYLCLRDEYTEVVRHLGFHHRQHSAEYYYRIRAQRPRAAVRAAARFLYLNRTCWNGLYRVNQQGQFNVPIGTKTSVLLPSDNFSRIAELLQPCEILCGDFEESIDRAGAGDFVFVDPPYTVAHNNNGFVKYNEKIFSWSDQVRLASCVGRAVKRGAKVLVTNADHESIHNLYKGFERKVMDRAGVIAGDKSARGRYSEVLIKCY